MGWRRFRLRISLRQTPRLGGKIFSDDGLPGRRRRIASRGLLSGGRITLCVSPKLQFWGSRDLRGLPTAVSPGFAASERAAGVGTDEFGLERSWWPRIRLRPDRPDIYSRPGFRQLDIKGLCDGIDDPASLRQCLRKTAIVTVGSLSAITFDRRSQATADEKSAKLDKLPPERVSLWHGSQPGVPVLEPPAMF